MNNSQITTIPSILKDCTILGTGFIPSKYDDWWFAIGNKKYWKKSENRVDMISFTAIGGHVEENESFLEATLREIKEETGSEALLDESQETYYVKAQLIEQEIFEFKINSLEKVNISDDPKPWIVYTLDRESDILGVVVYRGELKAIIHPSAEVPALIKLTPELLLKCPSSLQKLLELGAKIKEQGDPIPRNAILYPFGSIKIVDELIRNKNF